MNIEEYIASGILELYCLGNLTAKEEEEVLVYMRMHAEVRHEVEQIQLALEQFADLHAEEPPAHFEEVMSRIFDNLEKEALLDTENLPLINKYSDYKAWQSLVPATIPTNLHEERYCKVLTNNPDVLQMLVISSTAFEDEVHDDLLESFLILEGSCECTVDGKVRHMKAGEFMEIPLYTHHDVILKSPYVVAIIQRLAV